MNTATDTATESATINAFAVATLAAMSATRSITADTRDERGMVTGTVAPVVTMRGDHVFVTVPENFFATGAISREILAAARKAIREAFDAAGITAFTQARKQNGVKINVEIHGFWHMGQYCVTSRSVDWRIAA